MVSPALTKIFETRQVHTPDGRSRPLDSAIAESFAQALHATVLSRRPAEVLEVGMAQGVSTVAIGSALEALGAGRLTSIDPNQSTDWESVGCETIRRAGFAHRHTLIEEPDFTALPRLVAEGRRYDFVYIDGWHTFDYTLLDLFYADKLVTRGAIVAVNDCGYAAVAKALRWFTTHRRYRELDVGLATRIRPPIYEQAGSVRSFVRLPLKVVGRYAPKLAVGPYFTRFEDRYFEKTEDWEPSWDFFAGF
jgi:predicted O-methyltransferase YrrM